MMARPGLGADAALGGLRDRLAGDLHFPQTWIALTPLQRAVATVLADGADKPYGEASRTAIGKRLDGKLPTIAAVQTALRRLNKAGVVDRWSGRWLIDDPELAAWLRERVGKDGKVN